MSSNSPRTVDVPTETSAKRKRDDIYLAEHKAKYCPNETDNDAEDESAAADSHSSENGRGKRRRFEVPIVVSQSVADHLKKGESLILTMRDKPLLSCEDELEDGETSSSSDEAVEFENEYVNRMEKSKRNVEEKEKIKEYKTRMGTTGISSMRRDMNVEFDPVTGDVAQDHIPSKMKTVVCYDEDEDEEEYINEKPTARPTVPTLPDSQPKTLIKKRESKRVHLTNWGSLIGLDESESSQKDKPTIHSGSPNKPAVVTGLGSWKGLRRTAQPGDDGDEEDEVAESLYQTISLSALSATGENQRVSTNDVSDIVNRIRQEEESMQVDGSEVGFVDLGGFNTEIKKEEKSDPSALVMTDSTEFCRQIWTPVQRFEERRKVALTFSNLAAADKNKSGDLAGLRNEADEEAEDIGQLAKGLESSESMVFEVPAIDGSLSSAIKYLQEKGELDPDKWSLGRVGREKKKPLHKDLGDDAIKLDYIDAFGNVMNPKQAFRYISWAFHGKGPGKKKKEKLLKKLEIDKKLRIGSANPEENLPTMRALQAEQKKGRLFIQLGGGGNTSSSSGGNIT